jgi:thymidylate synthase ThyX
VLKNSSGLKAEKEASRSFHLEGTPLLVSSQLLRKRFLGQIDVARLRRDRDGWIIEVGEVKSSQVGVKQMEIRQVSRIISAQNFLAKIFGFRTKLIRIIQ